MDNKPKKPGNGPSGRFLRNRQSSAIPMLTIPSSSQRLRNAINKRLIEYEVKKAIEEIRRKEETVPKPQYSSTENVGDPMSLVPLFGNLGIRDSKSEKAKLDGRAKLQTKRFSHFAFPGPNGQLDSSWMLFKPLTKDQAVQTDPCSASCVLCIRENSRRYYEIYDRTLHQPIALELARPNLHTRDVAVEAPDRTYYGSDQLTFFRYGNFAYRGWTYRTLDGRIEHMPRYPRGIPLDQLRVEKPLRTQAPR